MKKYFQLWLTMTQQISQVAFASRLGVVLFTFGKLIRFVFFIMFLFLLTSQTKTLAGYTIWQVIFFFLTFNLIDTISQFLWRDVYRFRSYIISGNFDLILTKPISPLFRSLFGGSDILDLLMLIPLIGFMIYAGFQLETVTPVNILLYIVLLFSGFVIALSFHIFVLALGIVTTEVDNAIWIFREITQLGRIPLRVYPKALQFMFTYIIPVAALITIPADALFGIFSFQGIIYSFIVSGLLLYLSLLSWRRSLKHYSSASS